MDEKAMNARRCAGMPRRMTMSFAAVTFAALGAGALLAPGARAQSAGGGGASAGPLPTKVMVTTKDTVSGERLMIYQLTPQIDSLIKRLNGLPLGSPEFFAVDSAIQAALRLQPRASGERIRIEFTTPRAVLRGSPMDVVPQGWLGFTALGYNRTWYSPVGNYLQYCEYPTVVAIESNSPASRAGVRAGDSLVAYNGLDVRSQAINMTHLLEPGREVTVRLRREGESREFTMVVEKASSSMLAERRADVARMMASTPAADERRIVETRAAAVAAGRAIAPTAPQRTPTGNATVVAGAPVRATLKPSGVMASGVLGAAMLEVDPGLASSLRGMEGKRGVLVTFVPDGSLADRAGLRTGDVILRVESSDVSTVGQLGSRLYAAEANGKDKIKLTVLRAGKTQELTYAPPR